MNIAPMVQGETIPVDVQPGSSIKVSIHAVREAHGNPRVMLVASTLAEAGYKVSLIDIETHGSRPRKECVRGVQLQHVVIPGWLTSRRFEPLFVMKAVQALITSTIWLFRNNADIYHANDVNAMPATFLAAMLRKKPLIFELIDLQYPVPETGLSFWRRAGWFIDLMHRIILPRCSAVIVTSPLHGEELQARYHIPAYTLVRNTPPYQKVQKSDRLRQYLGLSPQTRVVLYQGYIQPGRGLDVLVDVASLLDPNIVIVMMGKGMGDTQAYLESLIRQKGVGDLVKIVPPVPYEELLEWTASADIGLVMSSQKPAFNLQRAFPNKVSEYLMAGLPVLAAPMDAVAAVIKQYGVGRTLSRISPAELAEGINSLLTDPDALAQMRANALLAAQELCWEKEREKLLKVYEAVSHGLRTK